LVTIKNERSLETANGAGRDKGKPLPPLRWRSALGFGSGFGCPV